MKECSTVLYLDNNNGGVIPYKCSKTDFCIKAAYKEAQRRNLSDFSRSYTRTEGTCRQAQLLLPAPKDNVSSDASCSISQAVHEAFRQSDTWPYEQLDESKDEGVGCISQCPAEGCGVKALVNALGEKIKIYRAQTATCKPEERPQEFSSETWHENP